MKTRQEMFDAWISGQPNSKLSMDFSNTPLGRFSDAPLASLFPKIKDKQNAEFKEKVSDMVNRGLKEIYEEEVRTLINQVYDPSPLLTEQKIADLEQILTRKRSVFNEFITFATETLKKFLKTEQLEIELHRFIQILELALEPYFRKEKTGIENIVADMRSLYDMIPAAEVKSQPIDNAVAASAAANVPGYVKSQTNDVFVAVDDLDKAIYDEYHLKLNQLEEKLLPQNDFDKNRANMLRDAHEKLNRLYKSSQLKGELLRRQLDNFYHRIEKFNSLLSDLWIHLSKLVPQNNHDDETDEDEKDSRDVKLSEEEVPAIAFLKKLPDYCRNLEKAAFDRGKKVVADIQAMIKILAEECESTTRQIQTIEARCCGKFWNKELLIILNSKFERINIVKGDLTLVIRKSGQYPEFYTPKITDTNRIKQAAINDQHASTSIILGRAKSIRHQKRDQQHKKAASRHRLYGSKPKQREQENQNQSIAPTAAFQ